MNLPTDPDIPLPLPPACGPTVDRIQAVLDGRLTADALAVDPHPAACATCRERVRAARFLFAALAEPAEPVAVPLGLTTAILAGVRADRRAGGRRRVALTAGLAAAIVVAAWAISRNPDLPQPVDPEAPELVERPPGAPVPAPTVQPIRVTDELAKTGDALRDSSRALAEPAASAPKVFAALTDSLLNTPAPPAGDPESAGQSLAEIPEAAKIGLEPVTSSAQKAFTRLLRDVGAIQPKMKS
ncbi:MAG: hypothetical protein JWO38_2937 [Gemmataceae bacterium]|nr:hypothetical protein [Gemmataceae bacterium]